MIELHQGDPVISEMVRFVNSKIPDSDKEKLREFFREHSVTDPHILLSSLNESFVKSVSDGGRTFLGYIEKETHYLLEKRGHSWKENERRFEGVEESDYQNARDDILNKLAKAFSEKRGASFPYSLSLEN